MNVTIKNSTFEKKESLYIFDMYTEEPYLEPQTYRLVTPHGGMTMSEGKFVFDGQIFSRPLEDGGNRPSGWSVIGSSK